MDRVGSQDVTRRLDFDDVLARYMERVDRGEPVDRDRLLAEYPEFADDLKTYLDGDDQLRRLVGTRPAVLPGGEPETAPASFGDYEILGEIARGGMGVVYRARQVSLNRPVALKMILAGRFASAGDVRRFRVEAEAVARLDHPNIVPIYEVGEREGLHFFSMKLVEGGSLADRLPAAHDDPREVARLVATIARTVEHAHRRGILHRDLKPANILLDESGRPHLTDFGLARRVDDKAAGASAGRVAGTPSYMAPEQVTGGPARLTTAVDVYGTGAILYELLAGHAPFRGNSPVEVLLRVVGKPPGRPGAGRPGVPRDLETICLKCLEKEPERRYRSAGALADELERWLRHEPIAARRAGLPERLTKWARREPRLAALTVLTAAAVALGIAAIGVGYARASRSLAAERRASYFHRIALAERAWSGNDVGRAEALLEECPTELRGFEWNYLKRLCHAERRTIRANAGRKPISAAFDPSGRVVAMSGDDGTVLAREAETGRLLWEAPAPAPGAVVRALAYRGDGRVLAVGGSGIVTLRNPSTGRALREFRTRPGSGQVLAVAFSPDGRRLAAATGAWSLFTHDPVHLPGGAEVWDADTGAPLFALSGHAGSVYAVAFRPDGQALASAGSDRTVRLWDADSGRMTHRLDGHADDILGVAFAPDGKTLASTGLDGTLRLWDADSGRAVACLGDGVEGFFGVAFAPDGKALATAGRDWTARLWDVASARMVATFRGHTKELTGVAFRSDGQALLSWGFDGTVKQWDVSGGTDSTLLGSHTAEAFGLAFRPDGQRLVSSGGDGALIEWDLALRRPARTLRGHARRWTSIAYDPSGRRIAAGGDGPSDIAIWDDTAAGASPTKVLHGHTRGVAGLAFRPDGRALASAGRDGVVTVWDLATGRPLATLRSPTLGFTCVAFSPDGRRLAAGTGDTPAVDRQGEVHVWDASSWREIATLAGHSGGVSGVTFSPDGRSLASSSWDKTVRLWDASTGRLLRTLSGQDLTLWGLTFAPDGRRLAAADNVGRIWLWDASTGAEALTIRGHQDRVYALAFSPDGRALASSSRDGSVRLWDATPLGLR